jgi:aryl-alcohol dehydrogenase-like predicted oxidoreductase
MRTVTLPGTDLTPSRLAFGSSLLMVRLGRRESVRLLEVALESGITHFDTARSYGYGEAESALGDVLARHRGELTVTTKLGMTPPRRSRGLRAATAFARVAANRIPATRSLLRRGAKALVQRGRFEPAQARTSLETSLRELRTDMVDILLLHECRPADLEMEGLTEFLEDVVLQGTVRYVGLGTDPHSTRAILSERPSLARVVQFEHDALDGMLDPRSLAGTAVITHSAVRRLLWPLTDVMRDDALRRAWSQELEADCSRPEVIGRLLLACALEANPQGVVLFSSSSAERIRSNAALGGEDTFSAEQLRRFSQLVRSVLGGRHPAASHDAPSAR